MGTTAATAKGTGTAVCTAAAADKVAAATVPFGFKWVSTGIPYYVDVFPNPSPSPIATYVRVITEPAVAVPWHSLNRALFAAETPHRIEVRLGVKFRVRVSVPECVISRRASKRRIAVIGQACHQRYWHGHKPCHGLGCGSGS